MKKQEGVTIAKSWSGKARMLTDKEKEVEFVQGRLIAIQRQIRRKILRKFQQDGQDVSWQWDMGIGTMVSSIAFPSSDEIAPGVVTLSSMVSMLSRAFDKTANEPILKN